MSIRLLVLFACFATGTRTLTLEGPSDVSVDRLGPVPAPRVVAEDGSVPEGLIWNLSREGVARIEGGQVIAEGPGEVEVSVEWEGSRVAWMLRVELETVLSFVSPPPSVGVGEAVQLSVHGTLGGEPIELGSVSWTSSDDRVLQVSRDGEAIGVAPGVAYVTARSGGGSAMVEVEVHGP